MKEVKEELRTPLWRTHSVFAEGVVMPHPWMEVWRGVNIPVSVQTDSIDTAIRESLHD